MPEPLPLVFTATQAMTRYGWTRHRWERAAVLGRVVPVRRDAWCRASTWAEAAARPALRHEVDVRAAMLALRREAWAAGWTAAQLHELPTPSGPAPRVHLVAPAGSRTVDTTDLVVRAAGLPAEHRAVRRGIAVTTVARTVVDVARAHGIGHGLVVADAALRLARTCRDELDRVVADCAGWPVVARARTVARHASGRRESPAESRSFALAVDRRLPLPECNPWLDLPDGTRVRPDFLWRAQRLVGEVDGRVKYTQPWPAVEPSLLAEKLRQDAVEDADHVVVRWSGAEVEHDPDAVVARLRRGADRAGRVYGTPAWRAPSPPAATPARVGALSAAAAAPRRGAGPARRPRGPPTPPPQRWPTPRRHQRGDPPPAGTPP